MHKALFAKLHFSILLFLILALQAPTNIALAAGEYNFFKIDDYISKQMQESRIPGLALGIVKDNQIIYVKSFGSANTSGRSITPQTPFIIGSVSKSFTAIAIMQLVETGKIDLDAPVQKYISWFRVSNLDDSSKITVRHLLNQTSGLSTPTGWRIFTEEKNKTLEQLVHDLDSARLLNSPGQKFEYSNANYLVLGQIIQTISNQSYGDYIKEHIFIPLKMQSSFTSLQSAQQNGLAKGYQHWLSIPVQSNHPYLNNSLPAGYLISSAEDMTHYLISQMNEGRYDDTSILSPTSISQLHQSAINISKNQNYGMGFYIEKINNTNILWHGGLIPDFNADMIMIPEKKLGIVVLENDGLPWSAKYIGEGVASLLLNEKLNTDGISPPRLYLIIIIASLFLISLTVLSLISLFKWLRYVENKESKDIKIKILPLGRDIILPLCYFIVPALLMDVSLQKVAIIFLPDFGYILLITMSLLLLIGVTRLIIFFKYRAERKK